MKALIVKEDGLIYAAEVPEQPKHTGDPNLDMSNGRRYAYGIEAAKESAVLLSDQEKAARLIGQKYQDAYHKTHPMKWDIKPGIYSIEGLDWEVGSKCELWCSDCKAFDWSTCRKRQVAILKESTDHIADVGKMVGKTDPETEQESQEEESYKSLIADVLYSTGRFTPEVCDEITDMIMKDLKCAEFTITRRAT